jgi:hypothetical protein
MKDLVDAFWRASAYCLHWRVILLSLLPLLVTAGVSVAAGYFYWDAAVQFVRLTLEGQPLVLSMLQWLDTMGGGAFRAAIAPLIVVALAMPLIVVLSLFLVAVLMTPALVKLVAQRRFPLMERKRGAGMLSSVAFSLWCTVLALLALIVSIPLWFVPPLVLVIPPLIWGWMTYRVMSFDVLADHASASEREELVRAHRLPLLGIGIVAGYLGAAPTLLWAVSAMTLVFAPVLVVVSVWLYTLVFAFAALWFAHYALTALHSLRAAREPERLPPAHTPPAPPLIAQPGSHSVGSRGAPARAPSEAGWPSASPPTPPSPSPPATLPGGSTPTPP